MLDEQYQALKFALEFELPKITDSIQRLAETLEWQIHYGFWRDIGLLLHLDLIKLIRELALLDLDVAIGLIRFADTVLCFFYGYLLCLLH